MMQQSNNELAGKKFLSLLVVSGLSISGISIFMLSDGFGSSSTLSGDINTLCNNGLCYDATTNTIPVGTFVQQHAEHGLDNTMISNNEDFSSFTINKNTRTYSVDGNTAIIFSSKDSFVREAIQNSNEGANSEIRVMGTGPTNNRALIAFDQQNLEQIMTGKSLESAKLKLYVVGNDGQWANDKKLNLHKLGISWDEGKGLNAPYATIIGTQSGVTWNCSTQECADNWNGGVFDATPSASVKITNDNLGQWIEFDVTGDVEDYLLGSPNNGWIIIKNDENSPGRINFAARESQTNVPQLELIFS